jgi:hypothetical protein|tara:strand:+ start:424 stop:714 length:291 start_codon:yes stop_codon:yes gene_type:complete
MAAAFGATDALHRGAVFFGRRVLSRVSGSMRGRARVLPCFTQLIKKARFSVYPPLIAVRVSQGKTERNLTLRQRHTDIGTKRNCLLIPGADPVIVA